MKTIPLERSKEELTVAVHGPGVVLDDLLYASDQQRAEIERLKVQIRAFQVMFADMKKQRELPAGVSLTLLVLLALAVFAVGLSFVW